MKNFFWSVSLLIFGFSYSQKNLIDNGSFEYDKVSWGNENVLSISTFVKKSGEKAGSITEYTSPQWKGIDQQFSIPKNTVALKVSAWMKADGIEKGSNSWNKGVMIVELDGKGQSIAELEGTTPWQYEEKIIPIDKLRSGKLMIALSECTGTLFFDDVKIVPLKQEEYNKITEAETAKHQVEVITDATLLKRVVFQNGDFEKGLEGWRGNAETTSEEKTSGTKSLKLTSENPVWYGIDQIVDIPEDATSVDISAFAKTKNLKPGKNDWNKAVMIAEFTSDGTHKTSQDQPIFITDIEDWKQFSKTLEIPQGSHKLRLMLALSEATGTFYADDIQLKFNK